MNGNELLEMMSEADRELVMKADDLPNAKMRPQRNIWKTVTAVVAGILVLTGVSLGIRHFSKADSKSYSVLPGDSEWDGMNSVDEKVRACQIPDEQLETMTNEELVTAVVEYPFLIEIFVVDDARTGVIWLRNNCDALRELTERGVATEELFSKASALNRMIRNGKTDDASVEIQFDALSMILFYTKEFREKLTTEELSVIMESNQVLWSVDMYGSDPV